LTASFAFLPLVVVSVAEGQQVVLQQPQREVFELVTVVSAPDRGGVHLGGVHSRASVRNAAWGVPGNVGLGGQSRASMSDAHVFIHDLEALDAARLEEPGIKLRRHPMGVSRSLENVASESEALAGLKRYRQQRLAYGDGAALPRSRHTLRSSGP
jgi:hypothetical protein